MKILSEKSDKNQQRCAPDLKRQEFLESVEDHQSNDESPEDHCADSADKAKLREAVRRDLRPHFPGWSPVILFSDFPHPNERVSYLEVSKRLRNSCF